MELLAPVGSLAAFEAALEEGADAIYIGAPKCNARALNRDFSTRELEGMISVARKSRVKVYFAMNSLIKEDELPQIIRSLALFESLQPDALIIQDLAVFHLVKKYFPSLTLHASTLMLVNNSRTVRQLIDMGFSRVVLPRELTMREIGEIHRQTKAELEVFVQGAMCFSYSGLCLFSTMHGGKSSLRGRCVQPCRRSYTAGSLHKQSGPKRGKKADRSGQYLFSMNDLSAIDLVADLKRAGVCSLKIEGRMKSGNYVGKTVKAYRMVLDNLDADERRRREVVAKAHELLEEAMGRKATTGYFYKKNPRGAITHYHSGNTGMFLGKVRDISTKTTRGEKSVSVSLILKNSIQSGDRLRLHIEKTGDRLGFTLRTLWSGNKKITRARVGQKVRLTVPGKFEKLGKIRSGSLYKVDVNARRSGGKKISRLLAGRKQKQVTWDSKKAIEIIDELTRNTPGNRLNPRSQPVESRKKRRSGSRGIAKGRKFAKPGFSWWIKVERPIQLLRQLTVRADRLLIPLDEKTLPEYDRSQKKMRRLKSRITWSLPPVINESDLRFYETAIKRLCGMGFNHWQLGHLSQTIFFDTRVRRGKSTRLHLSGDYTCNILNSVSLYRAYELGFDTLQLSVETDRQNLFSILSSPTRRLRGKEDLETNKVGLTVFGRLPLFTARVKADHFRKSQVPVSPHGEPFVLKMEQNLTKVYATQPFSLLPYCDELASNGLDFLVLDLRGSNYKLACNEIKQGLQGKKNQYKNRGQGNSGNYLGVLQ